MKDENNGWLYDSLGALTRLGSSDTVLSGAVRTDGGVTVIPISKVRVGLFGGEDEPKAKFLGKGESGLRGGAASVTPIAFLTVGPDAQIRLIHLDGHEENKVKNRVIDLCEELPDLIEKIKHAIKE